MGNTSCIISPSALECMTTSEYTSLGYVSTRVIGRAEDCEVRPSSHIPKSWRNTVSDKHALISIIQGDYYIRDLGSTNGTYVNGDKIGNNNRRLVDGDIIKTGFVDFKYIRGQF